jgi:hypothetical protein
MRRSFILTIIILAILSMISTYVIPNVSADGESGNITIESGHYMALPITANMVLKISYQIDVISGPNIDVILTDQTGYQAFNSLFSNVQYLVAGTRLNTAHASASTTVDVGTWYPIIDNSMAGEAQPGGRAATASYDIATSAEGISTGGGGYITFEGMLMLVLFIGLPLILVVVGWMAWSKKRAKLELEKRRYLEYQQPTAHNVPVYTQVPAYNAPPAVPQEQVNFCPGCGRPMPPGATFCEGCGRRLS